MNLGIPRVTTFIQSIYRAVKAVLPIKLKETIKRKIWGSSNATRPVRMAILNLLNEIKISIAVRNSSKYLQVLIDKKNLKVHLGCGGHKKSGWVNIDLSPQKEPYWLELTGTFYINYDLRFGLPIEFGIGSCDYIYSAHFFEHLEYHYGLKLMSDCYRALRPGGIFRMAMPNYKGLFEAYLQENYKYVELIDINKFLTCIEPGTSTFVDHINFGVYQNGEHKCIYDEEKLILILQKIGFSIINESEFKIDVDPDNELRRCYSFYIEAVK